MEKVWQIKIIIIKLSSAALSFHTPRRGDVWAEEPFTQRSERGGC